MKEDPQNGGFFSKLGQFVVDMQSEGKPEGGLAGFFYDVGQYVLDLQQDEEKQKRFIKVIEAIHTLANIPEDEQQEALRFVTSQLPKEHTFSDTFVAMIEYALSDEDVPQPIKQEAVDLIKQSGGILFQERLDELLFTNSKLENLIFGFSADGRSIDWKNASKIENGRITVSKPTKKKNAQDFVVLFDLDYSGVKGFIDRPLRNEERLVLLAAFSEFAKFYSDHGFMPASINTTSQRMMRTLAGQQVRSEELEQILIKGAETLSVVRIKIDMTQHAQMKGKAVKKDIITDYLLPIRTRVQEKNNGENVTYFEIGMSPILQYSFDAGQYYTIPARMLQLPEVGNKKYTKERTLIADVLIRNINMTGRNPRLLLSTLALQSGQPYESKVHKQRFREKLVDILEDWVCDPEVPVSGYQLEKEGRAFHAVTIDYHKE